MDSVSGQRLLKISGKRPDDFSGHILLPPSKSYLHRALFVASLIRGTSTLENCGNTLSDDVKATIRFLSALGVSIGSGEGGSLRVVRTGALSSAKRPVFVGGSGTTARFAIAFASLAEDRGWTKITGDESLSKRPMGPLLGALGDLGVKCKCEQEEGRLPILVRGGGIEGGVCKIDGSISSQFISSLLISCTQAGKQDSQIVIQNSSKMVSEPYVEATVAVLRHFGFKAKRNPASARFIGYFVKSNQRGTNGVSFSTPCDMSSGAAIIGAALSSRGKVDLLDIDAKLPQSDSEILGIARKFGARVSGFSYERKKGIRIVSGKTLPRRLTLNLGTSPDLVPAVYGMAAGLGVRIKIMDVGHLRFKESDRLHTLAEQIAKLGLDTTESASAIGIRGWRKNGRHFGRRRKTIVLDPMSDHRMLMAFAIAGLSSRFGEFYVSDPECVNKSYPCFISDLQSLMHESSGSGAKVLEIINKNEVMHS